MTSSGFISGAANLRTTVANIAERDALIASLTVGDLVPVADTGSGSPATFQFNGTGFDDLSGGEANVQSDWNETNATADSFIQNKPNLDGLSVSTIGGQPVLTIVDATRGNKVLSVAEHTITWDTNEIDNDKWVKTSLSETDEASIVLPLNATAVFASAYCVDADAKSKDVLAFVDTTSQGSIGTLAGIGPQNFTNTTLNIDINAGQRFRLKGNLTGDKIKQTIINIIFKWRA